MNIYTSIKTSGKKMLSATKFIDFFVNDILDYTILSKNKTNFTKNIAVFNIKTAVIEIIEILHDKCTMMNLNIETKFVGFDLSGKDNYLVKTDQKRI